MARILEKLVDKLRIEDDDEITVVEPSPPKNNFTKYKCLKKPKEDTVLKGLREKLRNEILGLLKIKVLKAVRKTTVFTSMRAAKTLVKRFEGPLKERSKASKTAQSASQIPSWNIKSAWGGSRTETERKTCVIWKRKPYSEASESESEDGWWFGVFGSNQEQKWGTAMACYCSDCSQILSRALREHEMYVATANKLGIKNRGNESKILSIGRTLDTLFHSVGVNKSKYDMASELHIPRMAADTNKDASGNRTFAEQLNRAALPDSMTHRQRQCYNR